jgi:hypothetical protein
VGCGRAMMYVGIRSLTQENSTNTHYDAGNRICNPYKCRKAVTLR